MDWLVTNWEWVLIAILIVDKIVAMTPTKQDDMIWSAVRWVIYKLAKKKPPKR